MTEKKLNPSRITASHTQETRDRMLALWNEGQSGLAIGKLLGISKNTVIGTIHRFRVSGLTVRTNSALVLVQKKRRDAENVSKYGHKPKKKEAQELVPLTVKAPKQTQRSAIRGPKKRIRELPGPSQSEAFDERSDFLTLTNNQCRWATGDRPPYRFCGKEGFPWCPEHKLRVYARRDLVKHIHVKHNH